MAGMRRAVEQTVNTRAVRIPHPYFQRLPRVRSLNSLASTSAHEHVPTSTWQDCRLQTEATPKQHLRCQISRRLNYHHNTDMQNVERNSGDLMSSHCALYLSGTVVELEPQFSAVITRDEQIFIMAEYARNGTSISVIFSHLCSLLCFVSVLSYFTSNLCFKYHTAFKIAHLSYISATTCLSTTTFSQSSNQADKMSGQAGRPPIVAKRTHVRAQKHEHTSKDLPIHTTLDRVVIGLSYAGIATYVYRNFAKMSPYELTGIAAGSLGLGYSLFDLGKRQGVTQGANFALRKIEDDGLLAQDQDADDWKGEFKGLEFEKLAAEDQISWLQNEATRIKELQVDEHLRCGRAYIKREEAYTQYEKRGHYGGKDWKA